MKNVLNWSILCILLFLYACNSNDKVQRKLLYGTWVSTNYFEDGTIIIDKTCFNSSGTFVDIGKIISNSTTNNFVGTASWDIVNGYLEFQVINCEPEVLPIGYTGKDKILFLDSDKYCFSSSAGDYSYTAYKFND